MSKLFYVEIVIAFGVVLVEALALFLGLRALVKRQDVLYREKYLEHLQLRYEVQKRIEKTKRALKVE